MNNDSEVEISPSSKPRILIVDDDSSTRKLETLFLKMAGFETDVAANGIAALKKLHENRYDLMITDLMMPEMGGPELICAVREAGMNLPILITAGMQLEIRGGVATSQEYAISIERHLFDGYLRQPYSARELVETVRKLLHKEEGGGGKNEG